MAAKRAKTFADRLTPLVPKEEADISHLTDEMADILYPRRRPRPFRLGVVFEAFAEKEYQRALSLARQSPVYEESGEAGALKHRADFDSASAHLLLELVDLVAQRPGSEILVDGKSVPYGWEIWLPLFRVFAILRT